MTIVLFFLKKKIKLKTKAKGKKNLFFFRLRQIKIF